MPRKVVGGEAVSSSASAAPPFLATQISRDISFRRLESGLVYDLCIGVSSCTNDECDKKEGEKLEFHGETSVGIVDVQRGTRLGR